MAEDKPTLYVDYEKGTVKGPSKTISRLFAGPDKSWYPSSLPESTIAISDKERLKQTANRLRELGFPLVEHPPA